MHTKNLENSSKIECFMGQNASVRTSMATTVYTYIYIFQGVYITLSTVALVENEVASGENWNAKKKTKEPAQNKTIRTRRDCEKRP